MEETQDVLVDPELKEKKQKAEKNFLSEYFDLMSRYSILSQSEKEKLILNTLN